MKQELITGEQINAILRQVFSMTDDTNAQCSILARAFVVCCKSCDVRKEKAMAAISQLFDEEVALRRSEQDDA
jgi:hypothetical protein